MQTKDNHYIITKFNTPSSFAQFTSSFTQTKTAKILHVNLHKRSSQNLHRHLNKILFAARQNKYWQKVSR